MTKKARAKWHLRFLCPLCPSWRKALVDVNEEGKCWWKENWKKKNYQIPANPGIKNWFLRILFLRTNLNKFKKIHKQEHVS